MYWEQGHDLGGGGIIWQWAAFIVNLLVLEMISHYFIVNGILLPKILTLRSFVLSVRLIHLDKQMNRQIDKFIQLRLVNQMHHNNYNNVFQTLYEKGIVLHNDYMITPLWQQNQHAQ